MMKQQYYIYILLFTSAQLQAKQDSWGDWLSSKMSWISSSKSKELTKELPFGNKGTIELVNDTGTIKIGGWNQPTIMLKATKRASSQEDLDKAAVAIKTSANISQISITTQQPDDTHVTIDYDIMVPKQAKLRIVNDQGDIKVKETAGSLDVSTHQGNIKLRDITGPVQAHTEQGAINVKIDAFPATSSLLLKTNAGPVTIKAYHPINAQLHAKTGNGTIEVFIPVTLDPITTILDKETRKELARNVKGTFGKGGAPITINVLKGDITIEEIE